MPLFEKAFQRIGLKSSRQADKPRSLRQGLRIYAIGDIHGCIGLLDGKLDRIYRDSVGFKGDVIEVFLGDYIDRGPDSRAVLERLASEPRQGHQRICLKGNHEEAMLSRLDNPELMDSWVNFGAVETLMSFGLDPQLLQQPDQWGALAEQLKHRLCALDGVMPWLSDLHSCFEMDDYYFVHAGIRPGLALDKQTNQDRLWIRDDFLNHTKRHAKMIVHGHTPNEQVEICDNRINLDTGAYATGQLSCLVLEGQALRLL